MGVRHVLCALAVAGMLAPGSVAAEVLGACGTKSQNKPAKSAVAAAPNASAAMPAFTRVPLPGEQAPNFELPAVVGKQIKKIKLSDYNGKWRVVCFYPADFTFV